MTGEVVYHKVQTTIDQIGHVIKLALQYRYGYNGFIVWIGCFFKSIHTLHCTLQMLGKFKMILWCICYKNAFIQVHAQENMIVLL